MAQLALKYSSTVSNAFSDLTLKKPISELSKMQNGLSVTVHTESSKKVSNEVWRIDKDGTAIVCERMGGLKLNLCAPSFKKLDISTICKISDSNNSDNVVRMQYIDVELSANVFSMVSFENEDACITFLRVIGYLMTKTRLTDAHERQISHICKVFDSLDQDGNGFLSFTEIERLFPRLNLKKKDKLFDYLYKKLTIESRVGMSTNEFFKFYHVISRLPDVEFIFVTYAFSNGSINVQHFDRFLKHEQKEKRTTEEISSLFDKLEVNSSAIKGCEFTLDGFMSYLFSESENSLKNPKFLVKPHIDSNRPLNEYFVKSCFITSSPKHTTIQLYTQALQKGFRHFEIDLYGVVETDRIVVGSSMESMAPVDLSQILDVFSECSDDFYPIILTLKIHFENPKLFEILFKTLIANIEKKLIIFDEKSKEMPIPNELFGKILIRSSISYAKKSEDPENKFQFNRLISLDDVRISSKKDASKKEDSSAHNTAENEDSDSAEKWYTTLSFDQSIFAQFGSTDQKKALSSTSSYFVSVVPTNTFQSCSPTFFFNFGVQSVVVPYNNKDENGQINDAFFENNANCGYMLKPLDMAIAANQPKEEEEDQEAKIAFENVSMISNFSHFPACDVIRTSISIICGRFMPDISIKPFIYLKLHGPTLLYGSTNVAEANRDVYRISPRWNNLFQFDLPVSIYRQTVLVISLCDNAALSKTNLPTSAKQSSIGTCAIHISTLRPGFRNVPLLDSAGNSLNPTSILIHTRKSRVSESTMSAHNSSFGSITRRSNEEDFNQIINT